MMFNQLIQIINPRYLSKNTEYLQETEDSGKAEIKIDPKIPSRESLENYQYQLCQFKDCFPFFNASNNEPSLEGLNRMADYCIFVEDSNDKKQIWILLVELKLTKNSGSAKEQLQAGVIFADFLAKTAHRMWLKAANKNNLNHHFTDSTQQAIKIIPIKITVKNGKLPTKLATKPSFASIENNILIYRGISSFRISKAIEKGESIAVDVVLSQL